MIVKSRSASRVNRLPQSATMRIADITARLRREGKDIISFSLGEPDFETPENIKSAAKRALDRGETHYTQGSGIPVLREAIATKLKQENGLEVQAKDVLVTTGAKQAIFEAICSLIDEGDDVLLFDPAWVSYEAMIRFSGGRPLRVPVFEHDGFIPTNFEEYVTPKTRLLILNSPCNPTGAVYPKEVIENIAQVAEDSAFTVLSDEVYEKIIYSAAHYSIGSLIPEQTVTINGFSKAYAMTGWRLGYAVAPEDILRGMLKIQQHSVSNATSFVQYAGVEALQGDQRTVGAMVEEFKDRRDVMITGLADIGVTCPCPQGAFYAFADVSQFGTSVEVTEWLLNKAQIAVTPGSAFGPNGEGFIRLSYATSRKSITDGLMRIGEVMQERKVST
ncbi:MAG: pyridoxal phosphate-dependent aminotransferase [Halobacteriota archaeon]